MNFKIIKILKKYFNFILFSHKKIINPFEKKMSEISQERKYLEILVIGQKDDPMLRVLFFDTVNLNEATYGILFIQNRFNNNNVFQFPLLIFPLFNEKHKKYSFGYEFEIKREKIKDSSTSDINILFENKSFVTLKVTESFQNAKIHEVKFVKITTPQITWPIPASLFYNLAVLQRIEDY